MSVVVETGASTRPEITSDRTPGGRVESAIRAANQDGRPALTAFITAGYPRRSRFVDTLISVAAEADVATRAHPRAPLAHYDRPRLDPLPAVDLDAQVLGITVTTVPRGALSLLMSDRNLLLCKHKYKFR